jgi:hypothetical protein
VYVPSVNVASQLAPAAAPAMQVRNVAASVANSQRFDAQSKSLPQRCAFAKSVLLQMYVAAGVVSVVSHK